MHMLCTAYINLLINTSTVLCFVNFWTKQNKYIFNNELRSNCLHYIKSCLEVCTFIFSFYKFSSQFASCTQHILNIVDKCRKFACVTREDLVWLTLSCNHLNFSTIWHNVLQSGGIGRKSGAQTVRYTQKNEWIAFVFLCFENPKIL